MENKPGKEMPWEQQKAILVEMISMKLPLLYQDLTNLYGEEEGKKIYADLYEAGYKRRAKMFEGKDMGDIMMAEQGLFPIMGWDLHIEKKEEDGEPVWYEHLLKCPHLDATQKYKMPPPCEFVCDMDCINGEKYKVGKWERLKHMPSGDDECCFKITRFK